MEQIDTIGVRAEIRADFMRRFFAVAISVGVGYVLSRMKWVTEGSAPDLDEIRHLFVLLTALYATILSWDGYLLSIRSKPLFSTIRFGIDVLLVFTYMLMIMTSANETFWLLILAVIFVLYVSWDFLTVREHYDKYIVGESVDRRATISQTIAVYFGGLFGPLRYSRGPVITLIWCAYVVGLAAIVLNHGSYNVYLAGTFAIVGLTLYRADKTRSGGHYDRGFLMRNRLMFVFSLLLAAALGPWAMQALAGGLPT